MIKILTSNLALQWVRMAKQWSTISDWFLWLPKILQVWSAQDLILSIWLSWTNRWIKTDKRLLPRRFQLLRFPQSTLNEGLRTRAQTTSILIFRQLHIRCKHVASLANSKNIVWDIKLANLPPLQTGTSITARHCKTDHTQVAIWITSSKKSNQTVKNTGSRP